jgi:uncharacterized membrane protein YfcA
VNPVELAVAAFITAGVGALGGLGGAILLVPFLVLSGVSARDAAPLGLISVAAGSLAAAPHQLRSRVVNHRLGISTEIISSIAALIGALASGVIGQSAIAVMLGVVALIAAFFGARRVCAATMAAPSAFSSSKVPGASSDGRSASACPRRSR